MSIANGCKDIPYEVIITSNSCYPKDAQSKLEREISNVTWCFNHKNGGFAYAMNQGMKLAQGKYVVIINPDVRIISGIDSMLNFMESNPDVGIIAPQILSNTGKIQDSARPYVTVQRYLWRCIKRVLGHKSSVLDNKMDYSRIQTVDWVIGAFAMARREVYQQTQGFDENYFMYAEDLDWCIRIRQCGYEVVYYPQAHVTYEGSRSARKSTKYARIFLRSHFVFWRKFGFWGGYPSRAKRYWE